MTTSTFAEEVKKGERFEFGKNWSNFLKVLNEERILQAERSMLKMFNGIDLKNKTFLDIGSGSGLSSLIAKRQGAIVTSFDYDPQSVACTRELKRRFFSEDPNWNILSGSALDADFLESLGKYDIVYSWGVLHHTGNMWKTFDLVAPIVKDQGIFFVAIYNDEKRISDFWKKIKKFYCSGWFGRNLTRLIFFPGLTLATFFYDILTLTNPFKRFANYKNERGMSYFYDIEDWLGGYPFEVASPEEMLHCFQDKKFQLVNMKTTNRMGCNEFVFKKD